MNHKELKQQQQQQTQLPQPPKGNKNFLLAICVSFLSISLINIVYVLSP
jgi:hypothetical protein